MARFCTLCSSSSGNCTYIGTSSYGILIDAGSSCRQITLAMQNAGIDPDSVKAIFVTHEHKDHTGAIKVFASKRGLPVYATGGTLSGMLQDYILSEKYPHEKIIPAGVTVGDIHVTYFRTSHDARESCGYRIELPDRTIGVATDTGIMTDDIRRGLIGCDAVLIESNYDEDLLDRGPYPAPLKRRIRSDIGHLSNDACAAAVCDLLDLNVRRFFLGHLSRENNKPDRAYSCTHAGLKRIGAEEGRDYTLAVAPEKGMERYIII